MREYRGIKLSDKHQYYSTTMRVLDKLADTLEERNHKLVGVFISAKTKFLVDRGCKHGPQPTTWDVYKKGCDCKLCSYEYRWKNRDKQPYINEINRLAEERGHKWVDGEYVNARTKTLLIDYNCGHQPHMIRPENYIKGYGCPECKRQNLVKGDRWQKAKESFMQALATYGHQLANDSTYDGADNYVYIKFNCNCQPHRMKPNNYKAYGHSYTNCCPICTSSKGEIIIATWLHENNIIFIREYAFDDLPRKRFDFYLPNYNLIIEVHGVQHYEEVCFGKNKWREENSRKTLIDEQENDTLKKNHVLSKEISYMVVDYRESNPELTLGRFIKQFENFKRGD